MLDGVVVDLLAGKLDQKAMSKELRKAETKFRGSQERVAAELVAAQLAFMQAANAPKD